MAYRLMNWPFSVFGDKTSNYWGEFRRPQVHVQILQPEILIPIHKYK
jgi:hypothetical protein